MQKKHWTWPLLLLLISLIVAGLNFRSGVWLTGWDTLHPEFDFSLNFSRQIFGVWREDQGLGTLAAHAHMSELPRTAILWLLHLLIPIESVRLVYVLLCFVLGPMGIYWFLRNSVLKKTKFADQASFLSGLWYIFNLGTAQHFVAVFEMFAVQYAAIGWTFYFASQILAKPSKRNYVLLAMVGLLSTPQAYASQLWFVLFGGLVSYLVVLGLLNSEKKLWRRILIVAGLLLAVNSFWLLPNLFFLKNGAGQLQDAFINKTFSPESFIKNQEFGTFSDLALLKNFLFDFKIYRAESGFEEVMQVWKNHLNLLLVKLIGWTVFILGLVGLIVGMKKKNQIVTALIPALGLTLFALINANPPFTSVFNWLRDHSGLFAEGFRTPFTKFSILYMLCFSVFFGVEMQLLIKKIPKISHQIFILIISIGLIYFGWPFFQSQLIHPLLRQNIPSEYFSLFDEVKKDPNGRLALLPLGSPWGWEYHDWGYQGPGFTWFGMSQSVLTRDFDRWSPYNETFYNELSTAFYYCPPEADDQQVEACARNVKRVFDKYQVSLALLDESVILPGQDRSVMRYELWKKVLAKLDPEVDFARGFLSVYRVGNNSTGITVPEKFQTINANTTYGRFDPFYDKDVAYVEGKGASYPFALLSKENLSGLVEYTNNGVVKIKGSAAGGGKVTFPEFSRGDVWQGRIRATLAGEELKIELLPFGQLVIGQHHLPLWLDQRLEVIRLPAILESVIVQVEDQVKVIERDRPDEIWGIPMTVGEGLTVQVFESKGQEINISTPSARLGQLPKDRLITVSGNEPICLGYEQKHYKCLNQNHHLVTSREGVYWFDALETMRDLLVITIHQPIAEYEFDKDMWQQVKREYEVDAGEAIFEMTVVPIEAGSWKLEANSANCDVLKRGSAVKKIVAGGVVYEANQYGAYCDSWWVNPINEEGLLRLTGENVAGRGLKLSVFSTQEYRTNLEQLLPNRGQFDQSYGFLTGLQQGATINVETKSFGRIEGRNQLNAVRFYPTPLTWLQKIKVGEEKVVENQLQILETKKWGTGIYRVKTNGSGLLVLNQGFDNGWIAPGLDHVKVNGWSNGFIVDETGSKSRVVWIIYWPQILEWLGLMGLVGGLTFLVKMWYKTHVSS